MNGVMIAALQGRFGSELPVIGQAVFMDKEFPR
jgi:hypothetical protein